MVSCLDDLGGRPDQHVGIPDGGHAVLGDGFDTDDDGAGFEVDRRHPLGLAEREERVRHQVLRIAQREIAGQRPEEIELLAFAAVMARRHARTQRGKRSATAGETAWRLAGRTVPPRGSEVEVTRPRSAQA